MEHQPFCQSLVENCYRYVRSAEEPGDPHALDTCIYNKKLQLKGTSPSPVDNSSYTWYVPKDRASNPHLKEMVWVHPR